MVFLPAISVWNLLSEKVWGGGGGGVAKSVKRLTFRQRGHGLNPHAGRPLVTGCGWVDGSTCI